VKTWQSAHISGSPDTVTTALTDLVERTGADELMVTAMIHDPAARLRSYALLAETVGLRDRIGARTSG
jgi:alkanesulfonate monooxygenase SsuD/methylene tetrahydromethanopterin reductase-like flavin-dependent oxidoreductase (luciferase family)